MIILPTHHLASLNLFLCWALEGCRVGDFYLFFYVCGFWIGSCFFPVGKLWACVFKGWVVLLTVCCSFSLSYWSTRNWRTRISLSPGPGCACTISPRPWMTHSSESCCWMPVEGRRGYASRRWELALPSQNLVVITGQIEHYFQAVLLVDWKIFFWTHQKTRLSLVVFMLFFSPRLLRTAFHVWQNCRRMWGSLRLINYFSKHLLSACCVLSIIPEAVMLIFLQRQ